MALAAAGRNPAAEPLWLSSLREALLSQAAILATLACVLATLALPAPAQEYPAQTIKIIYRNPTSNCRW